MFRFITRNFRLKLVALAVAVGMWVIVMGQDQAEITVEIPVEVAGIPQHVVVTDDVVNKVSARLVGPASLVRRAAVDRPVKSVDLTGMGPGEHVFQVVPSELRLPSGVEVMRISPARFTITLAEKVAKVVPVRPVLKGDPAKGWEVAEVVFTPPKITASGSKSEVETVDWVWTVPMDIAGLKENQELTVAVRSPRSEALRLEPDEVTASIKVRKVKPDQKPAPAPEQVEKETGADSEPEDKQPDNNSSPQG